MKRVHLIVGLLVVVVALCATYVAAGADLFLAGRPYPEARERLKLVFSALGALAAPLSLWVALTAYQLNARLASINLSARLDSVPPSSTHMDETRVVRYPGGRDTDLSECEIQFTADPDGEGHGDGLFCAVPLVNLGPSRATIVSATASVEGLDPPRSRLSASVVLAGDIVFLSFAWAGVADPSALTRSAEPQLSVRYTDGAGGSVLLTAVIRSVGTEAWQLEDLGQK